MKAIIVILGLIALSFSQIADYTDFEVKVVYYCEDGSGKVVRMQRAENNGELETVLPGSHDFWLYTWWKPIHNHVSTTMVDSLNDLEDVQYVVNGADSTKDLSNKNVGYRHNWMKKIIRKHYYIKDVSWQD